MTNQRIEFGVLSDILNKVTGTLIFSLVEWKIAQLTFCFFLFNLQTLCRISVTFVDKDGEENHIKVPTGMSMLEAAHENDIELEGKSSSTLLHQNLFPPA